MQFEHRVGEEIRYIEARQGRSDSPDEEMFGNRTGDNKAADANTVPGAHPHASGEVQGLRRGRVIVNDRAYALPVCDARIGWIRQIDEECLVGFKPEWSPLTGTLISLLVSPGPKVSVPLVAV